jgi:hypothetical protein
MSKTFITVDLTNRQAEVLLALGKAKHPTFARDGEIKKVLHALAELKLLRPRPMLDATLGMQTSYTLTALGRATQQQLTTNNWQPPARPQ